MGDSVSATENVDSQWSDEIPDGQVVAAELRKNCCGISRRMGSLETCLATVGIGRNSTVKLNTTTNLLENCKS